MTSEALKLARVNAKRDRDVAMVQLAIEAMKNPVIEILAGTLVVEYVHRQGIWNDKQRDNGGMAVIGAVIVQQLAPAMPSLFQAGSQIFQAGVKAIPAIAAGASSLAAVL